MTSATEYVLRSSFYEHGVYIDRTGHGLTADVTHARTFKSATAATLFAIQRGLHAYAAHPVKEDSTNESGEA